MTSRPPIVATSIEEAVRIALPYLRIARAGMGDAPYAEPISLVITMLETALSREAEPTKRTEIPKP